MHCLTQYDNASVDHSEYDKNLIIFKGLISKKWEASNTGGRNISQIVPNTNFVAFKTPLSEELFAQSSYEERFKVSDILDATGIKMWINLVGQHRRFDSAEIIAQNVDYFEMQVEGKRHIDCHIQILICF